MSLPSTTRSRLLSSLRSRANKLRETVDLTAEKKKTVLCCNHRKTATKGWPNGEQITRKPATLIKTVPQNTARNSAFLDL